MLLNGRLIECNAVALQQLGVDQRRIRQELDFSLLLPEKQADGVPSCERIAELAAATADMGYQCAPLCLQRGDGSEFSVDAEFIRVGQEALGALVIKWRSRSESELLASALGSAASDPQGFIFENAHVGISLVKNRQIIKSNGCMAELLGVANPEQLVGRSTLDFYPSIEQGKLIGREIYLQLAEKGWASTEVEFCRADGKRIWVLLSGSTLDRQDVINSPSVWVFTDITTRKQHLLALQKSEEKFSTAFDCCPLAASISQISDGRFIEVNASYQRNFGWSREDLVGKTSLEIGFWRNTAERDAWLRAIFNAGLLIDYDVIWKCKSGELREVSLSSEIIHLGGQECILTYLTDITERKRSESDLRIAATAFESQEGMLVTDAQGVILRVNRAFSETTGYSAEEVVGKTPSILRSGRHDEAFYRQMWQSILESGSWQGQIWDRRKNGEIYPKWLTISAVKDSFGDITNFVATHFDITDRIQAEERINTLAFFDQLTGLPNRTLLQDRLGQLLASGARSNSYGALLFIDLDHFKTLNDTKGHEVGDLLLKEIATRLLACIRETDTAARLGGDEFVVVLGNLGGVRKLAAAAAETVAEKILDAISQPYQLGHIEHRCSASLGVTMFHGNRNTTDELMRQADLAMYRSKASGRGRVHFFDPLMEAEVHAQVALEHDLRRAINHQQFVLQYQPQVLSDGQVVGAEALIRWLHPQRGLVSPGEFIPAAEETGLIVDIGMWVLKSACCQLADWSKKVDMSWLSLAVNVSAHQFHQPNFVDEVISILRKTGARPERLKLELTESMLAHDVENVIHRMQRLRDVGVQFSLDDFGTGYSSLTYLQRLPLDQLKIDQSFVRDVLSNPSDAAIAKTVVALGKTLGLAVIAEGVETEEQRRFLMESGCHAYQGYLYSRPLNVEEFSAYVHSDRGAA